MFRRASHSGVDDPHGRQLKRYFSSVARRYVVFRSPLPPLGRSRQVMSRLRLARGDRDDLQHLLHDFCLADAPTESGETVGEPRSYRLCGWKTHCSRRCRHRALGVQAIPP